MRPYQVGSPIYEIRAIEPLKRILFEKTASDASN